VTSWWRAHSLRRRLTLWYVAVMVVVLAVYAIAVLAIVRQAASTAARLRSWGPGGVPGRGEIDETQELNYRFIANAIADSGYTGYVAHEHRPSMGKDPIQSLEKCFEILNV